MLKTRLKNTPITWIKVFIYTFLLIFIAGCSQVDSPNSKDYPDTFSNDSLVENTNEELEEEEIVVEEETIETKEKEETNLDEWVYKYNEYYDYEKEVIPQLESEVDTEVIGGFGNYAREEGKIFMVMHDNGGDFNENYRFWAVEINGETSELIEYKEISNDGCPGQPGKCPNDSQLWW